MTNPKIERVISEIEKIKSKISEFQAKLRALEKQKTDLENEQIVSIVRGEKISDAELAQLMKSLRKEEPAPAVATAAVGKITGTEETRYADTDD